MSNKIVCPHGLVTQIAYLFEKKSVNLFCFEINSVEDYHHQKKDHKQQELLKPKKLSKNVCRILLKIP